MVRKSSQLLKRWMVSLSVFILVACTARAAELPAPQDVLPAVNAVPGWRGQEDTVTYDRDTLRSFMDSLAEVYVTYGFEELAVGRYVDAEGDVVQVEVYRVATDADAYGLFMRNSRDELIDLGVDGELEHERRLAFWQSRTFVQIVAQNEVDDAVLRAFGAAVASALPGGGERPSLIAALPAEGMVPGSVRFFREETALDGYVWLGTEDVLGLGGDTQGVLAWYGADGPEMILMLIAFPDAASAEKAWSALRQSGIESLVTTDVTESTLGAVFGQLDEGATTKPSCDCGPDEVSPVSDQLPEQVATELLRKAMSALP